MSKINLYDLGLTQGILDEKKRWDDKLFLGRVSVQHKNIYRIITEEKEIYGDIVGKLNYNITDITDYPVVGDWVLIDRKDERDGNAKIHGIITRKSSFERKAAGTAFERQIIASNIDIVFICMSLNNDYNLRRIERYLSIAWDSGATPVIVLTKADLCQEIEEKLYDLKSIAIGVDIIVTSSKDETGFTEIKKYLKNGVTIAFIGSSGVGKSTLINKLIGQDLQKTMEIREDDDRGRHATTHRQLFLIPGGGVVIDTPGMREIQITSGDLSHSFADIEELAQDCFFKDCKHEAEPKCAVKKAIEDGVLSLMRFENFKKLQQEIIFNELKTTHTAAQMQKEKTIKMMGSLKAYKEFRKHNKKK